MSRACSVCEGTETKILFRQNLILPEGRCSYTGHDIVACSTCGFLYADAAVSQPALDTYYASPTKVAQALAEVGEPPEDIVRLDNSVNQIMRFLKPEATVLDVGCGTGRLLSLLKRAGFDRVCGIDPSPAAAHIARAKYGVEVKGGSIFDYAGERFDCITACHVLEHIVDARGFVRRIRTLLSQHGTVYFEVPDVYQFGRFVDPSSAEDGIYMKDLFTHFAPEHVNFFSTVSLRNLMRRMGFEEVYCESHPLGMLVSGWMPCPVVTDDRGVDVLVRYAACSRELQKEALCRIRALADSGQEVLVWGAGLHTQRLLGSGNLGCVNIRAYIDSDPSYRGARLAGKPIIGPDDIQALDGNPPILISSWRSQMQIEKAIRSRGLANRVILLYSNR